MRIAPALLGLALGAGAAGAQAAIPSPPASPTYRRGVDVQDYDLTLHLPDTGNVIAGRAVLRVRRTARLDSLTLDLRRLRVDSVLVNGAVVGFSRTDSTFTLPLPPGMSPVRVGVVYGGGVEDGLIVRTDSAGRWTAFGDNWPNRARYWIPSVDHPSDKATVTWRVSAPSNRTVVANGSLVARTPAGSGRTITQWRERRPISPYLMVIAAAPLVVHDLGQTACGLAEIARCVPQMVYTAPEQSGTMPGNFARAGDMVRFFARVVGPFPYERLAHLQSSTRFGGMENATAIFYSDRAFRLNRVSEGLIAHETAHQWFGNAVTEREWGHLWLSEGFATYFAALWTQHAHGDSAFRAEMAGIRTELLGDSTTVVRRPVIDTLETNLLALLNLNSYQKGGFVLHMLRALVGDSAFFRGLRRYHTAHRHGTALTDDLERAMERASRRELSWFFDQWLRRPGYPELQAIWARDDRGGLTLEIGQGGRFGTYRFPLTVVITDASGQRQRVRLDVPAAPRTVLTVPGRYTADPTSVELDPDVQLLGRIETRKR